MARFYSLNPLTNVDPGTLSLTRLLGAQSARGQGDRNLLECAGRQEARRRVPRGEWRVAARLGPFRPLQRLPMVAVSGGQRRPRGGIPPVRPRAPGRRTRKMPKRSAWCSMRRVSANPATPASNRPSFSSPATAGTANCWMPPSSWHAAATGSSARNSPNLNPEGMIRVRVKVRRIEVDMERKFEITAVLACHWYAVDDPGVEPADPLPAAEATSGPLSQRRAHHRERVGLREPMLECQRALMQQHREPVGGPAAKPAGQRQQRRHRRLIDRVIHAAARAAGRRRAGSTDRPLAGPPRRC